MYTKIRTSCCSVCCSYKLNYIWFSTKMLYRRDIILFRRNYIWPHSGSHLWKWLQQSSICSVLCISKILISLLIINIEQWSFLLRTPILLLIIQILEFTQTWIFPSLKWQSCDMKVSKNEQLEMKCLFGLKSKPQNLKNLLAVISCRISYKGLLNDLSKFPSALIPD